MTFKWENIDAFSIRVHKMKADALHYTEEMRNKYNKTIFQLNTFD